MAADEAYLLHGQQRAASRVLYGSAMASVTVVTTPRFDARAFGVRLTLAGAAAQLSGIGVDAWLHAADPGLAEREGIFSLSNAGHALLVAGICLVVVGAFFALVGPAIYGAGDAPGAGRVVRVGAPVALVSLLAAGTAFGATSSLARGHGDHEGAVAASDGHAHTAASTRGAAGAAPATVAAHGHGDGTVVANQPLDPPTRAALAEQLVEARAVAMAHPTVADALRDGYVMVTPYVPLIGAHYMKFPLVDATFDVRAPEMLLYDGTDPGSRIVGLSYYVVSPTEPEGFAGPNDHWHRHIGLCLKIVDGHPVVIGAERTTPEACRAMGGFKADGSNGWMVHAWVVPGWESPVGVFSAEHPDLR
jgi:hypothetical protein